MNLRHYISSVLLLCALGFEGCHLVQPKLDLTYTVSVATDFPACRITLDIKGISQRELILETPIQSNIMNVDEVAVVDGSRNPLPFESVEGEEFARNVAGRFKFAKWKIQLAGVTRVIVTYRANLGYQERGELYGYIGHNFGLVAGCYLFIIPEKSNRIGRVQVNFDIPSAWEVILPKPLINDGDYSNSVITESMAPLLNAQIAWGPFRETTQRMLNTTLHVYTYADWPDKYRESLVNKVASIGRQHIGVTGGIPSGNYTIIFTPKSVPDSSKIYVPASFEGQGQCMDPSTDTDWIHFSEELFKRYTTYNTTKPMRFEDPRDRWYKDGLAGFYGIQALDAIRSHDRTAKERLRLLYFQYVYSTFPPDAQSGVVRLPFDRYPLAKDVKLSRQAQSQHQRVNAPVMLYLIDRQIRLHSDNSMNLDDLVRMQYDNRRNEFVDPINLRKELRQLAGHDFGDFFRKRIYEPNFVDEPLYLPFIKHPLPANKRASVSLSDTLIRTSKLTLILTGGNESYLENCGCALNQSGGVARRATVIEQIRKKSPNVLIMDVGDVFPKLAHYDALTILEAETYLRAMDTIGFHSLGVSSNEIYAESLPSKLSSSLSFPILSSNIAKKEDRSLLYQPHNILEIGGIRVGIVGFSPPVPFTLRELSTFDKTSRKLEFRDPIDAVQEQVTLLRTKCDLIILSAGVTFPYLLYEIIEEIEGIDVAVGTNDKVFQALEPNQLSKGYIGRLEDGFVNQTLFLFSRGGPYISEWFDLEVDPQGNIVSWKRNSIPLDEEIGDDPDVRDVIEGFHSEVRKRAELWDTGDRLFKDEFLEQSIAQDNAFVGVDACASCHSSIVKEWKQTPHATAFNTLIRARRNYYARCVVCHTVGFGYETGFKLGEESGVLLGVQCESCHGPGKKHMQHVTGLLPLSRSTAAPRHIRSTVSVQHCMECHDQEHSPGFDARAYIHQQCAPMKVASFTSSPEPDIQTTSESPPSLDGSWVYQESGCATCHGRNGAGTALGPSLMGISKHWNTGELVSYIRNPSSFRNTRSRLKKMAVQYPGPMPSFELDAQRATRLVEFLINGMPVPPQKPTGVDM